jgi:hypothetical protein
LAGEREVKKALGMALFKHRFHADEDLLMKAYSYIRRYYCASSTAPPESPVFGRDEAAISASRI